MNVHEYQAKRILAEYGVPVPRGGVAASPAEAEEAARDLGGRAVVKAQVHAGGRGKAGGVRLVSSPKEAGEAAASLLGTRLVTFQTGPEGAPIGRVLVEETIDVARELYLGILIDGAAGGVTVIASEVGGMDIEEVAETTPERILRVVVDPVLGLQPYQGRRIAYGLNLPAGLIRPVAGLVGSLYRLFEERDCVLIEINPLVVTSDAHALAVDAKLNFDDDALFRHGEIAALRDPDQEDPREVEAQRAEVSYVKLDGDVGCMVNGAGAGDGDDGRDPGCRGGGGEFPRRGRRGG